MWVFRNQRTKIQLGFKCQWGPFRKISKIDSDTTVYVLYTGWAKSQFTVSVTYVGSYTNVVFYIRGLLLCKWHTVPTCSRIPSSKFENSNILLLELDHALSI